MLFNAGLRRILPEMAWPVLAHDMKAAEKRIDRL
jgi:hypothetical protein